MEGQPLILTSRKSSFDESTNESKWNTRSASLESEPISVKYTRRIGWPLAVVVGQALLLAFSWGFLFVVRSRGQIPLPSTLAEFVEQNPQSKTYMITFLSTTLSTLSSYLFSQAVQQAILVHLNNPTTISTLRFGISVSTRSFLLDLDNIKVPLVTGAFFLAALGQTASWSSLLTPNNMIVYTPLQGTEIDLSSQALVSQFTQLFGYYEDGATQDGIYNYLSSALLSVIDTSGAASTMARLGYPTVLDYAEVAYEGSTSGISPIFFYPDAPTANRTSFVTYNTVPFPPTTTTFNITMSQQGLTAAVSCQNRTGQLDTNSDPPFQRLATQAEMTITDESSVPYTAVSFMSVCAGTAQYSQQYFTQTNNTVIALACPQNDSSGENLNTYTVIIDSQGPKYQDMGTMVCSVAPQIQNMISYYTGRFVYSETDSTYAPMNAPMNATAFYWGLVEGIMYGQGPTRNAIGDVMESMYTDQMAGERLDYLTLWEAYIRGVVEFVGTAMKAILAANTGPLQGHVPLDMMKLTNGTAITTTLGWQYKELASFAVLIPSTFFAIASILIVLFAQLRSRGVPVQHSAFDPSNPLALMAAASAGGMGNTFHGLTKEDVKEGQRKKVKLGQVGGKAGFVQVKTISESRA
ncbi:hypothetical protein MSAN_00826500 [Mycena sanguinolenta]|uniref:Uncharacterized protein n=1 Tax=Mycena sanguinolenta TaxID=230812 RepID=A0A8H7D9V3_9AGAR|nr:hypothetical protein MSAN_00826500 [Mycena sanguinolenta]